MHIINRGAAYRLSLTIYNRCNKIKEPGTLIRKESLYCEELEGPKDGSKRAGPDNPKLVAFSFVDSNVEAQEFYASSEQLRLLLGA